MAVKTEGLKYCVLGAGASGLAVAKTFKQRGIPFDCLERESDLGGLWNAGTASGLVYKTCHMVSSKNYTGFEDFPFAEEDPVYPSHAQALDYLRSYARNFGILDAIHFGKTVERIEHEDGAWQVRVAGERTPRRYRGVVLANGHHEAPRWPEIPGAFAGEMMHSRDYKGPEQLAGKRVLLIGAGNSGCDIAIDGVHHAKSIIHSMRRGYYFVPKFTLGRPTDEVVSKSESLRCPRWLKQRIYWLVNRLLVGPAHRHGLPTPEHRILDTHPTISSEIPGLVAHGRITVKPDVTGFEDRRAHFADGSTAEVDMVICATGYAMSFPFLDETLILDDAGRPKLYLNVFHPEHDDLFAAGLVQANGSIWRLADDQGQLIANYIVAMAREPAKAAWFRKLKSAGAVALAGRGSFVASARHTLEFDYYEYRRMLKRLIRKFGALAAIPLEEGAARAGERADARAEAQSQGRMRAA